MNADIFSILSGGEELVASFANAFAETSQSNFIANQFKINEQIANVQAQEAITQGQVEQEISQQKNAQLSGQQVVAEAAQGVDVHTGTAAITREQTGEIGGKDYLTLGNNAFLKSLGYKIEGENANVEATLQKSSGENKAANSLLGGANDLFQSTMKAMAYDKFPSNGQIDSTIQ